MSEKETDIDASDALVQATKGMYGFLDKEGGKIDADTVYAISGHVQLSIAQLHDCLAILERIKGRRQRQVLDGPSQRITSVHQPEQ